MTRPTTRRTNRPSSSNRNNGSRGPARKSQKQPQNKGAILLKSMVVMLGIVFLTLITAFFIIQSQTRYISAADLNCSKARTIEISNKVEKIISKDTKIFVLTKESKSGRQDLIKLDGKCLNELGRIKFHNRNK